MDRHKAIKDRRLKRKKSPAKSTDLAGDSAGSPREPSSPMGNWSLDPAIGKLAPRPGCVQYRCLLVNPLPRLKPCELPTADRAPGVQTLCRVQPVPATFTK